MKSVYVDAEGNLHENGGTYTDASLIKMANGETAQKAIDDKADKSDTYTKSQVDGLIAPSVETLTGQINIRRLGKLRIVDINSAVMSGVNIVYSALALSDRPTATFAGSTLMASNGTALKGIIQTDGRIMCVKYDGTNVSGLTVSGQLIYTV